MKTADAIWMCLPAGMDELFEMVRFERTDNASAEAFNSKVKIFRSQMRGVRDRNFFIFRLVKLYA